jgi:fructose-1,6-bisphosphatase/inositol monophosphatase family enzyme
MVALMWNGVPVQCWIWLPVTQMLYYAAAGDGAHRYHDKMSSALRIGQRPVNPLDMSGSGNTKGLIEPQKSQVLNRMRTISGRHYIGSAGVLASRIADGTEDFLIHSRSTPWDHAPVDLLCREAGGHAAMVAGAKPFNAVDDGAIMAVSSLTGWQHLHQHVWRDD